MKKRMDEVVIAKAIAIIGVMFVHGTSSGLAAMSGQDSFYVYNFLSTLGRWGTPTFMMLGAFILFYTYSKRELSFGLFKSFYWKRVKFILIPYVVITLFYFLTKWNLNNLGALSFEELVDKFTYGLIYGKTHAHLYFVVISVQFYLLFPFIMIAMKKLKIVKWFAIPIGIIAQITWIYLNREYFQVQYKGSVVFSYMAFYMTGAFVGMYYDKIKEVFSKKKLIKSISISVVLVGMIIGLSLYVYYNVQTRIGSWMPVAEKYPFLNANNAFELFWGVYALFASFCILLVANAINKGSGRFKRFLMAIGATSFGIYLIHPFYLAIFRNVFAGVSVEGYEYHLAQIAIYLIVFTVSYLTVRIVQKIKFGWIVFGKKESGS